MNTKDSRPTQADNGTYCAFEVGQHVVLVPDAIDAEDRKVMQWAVCRHRLTFPEPNKVYRVRRVEIVGPKPAIWLDEISNPVVMIFGQYQEAPFPARWFRPLQKLTPEAFMSADAPVKVGEPA